LAGSLEGRLSVSVVEVADGQEDAFLAIAREFSLIMAKKNYGRTDIVRDESSPNMFYAVRHWASASAAEACHADADVAALRSRLHRIAKVTHLVNGVRLPAGKIDLVSAARRARENAEARFSRFKVGAALEASDGAVITGCNVENATYGLTVCAERVAVFKAISEGYRTFTRIAIVADTVTLTPPCGACRQILWEFGGNLDIVLANLGGDEATHRLKDLLPLPFDARLL
jgi:cytidine deaminase